jgi:predicted site-specific integrase-resolvase
MTIEHMLPLRDAAARLRLPELKLRALIEKGKIKALALPDGELYVSEQAVTTMASVPKEELPEYKKHAHLKGQAISINEAARKYEINPPTLWKWVQAGHIATLSNDGYRLFIDEADVAYCAEVYHQKGGGRGRRLFGRDGTPYKPKTGPLKETK